MNCNFAVRVFAKNGFSLALIGALAVMLSGCYGYRKSDSVVTWHSFNEGIGQQTAVVESADAATFSSLSSGFARDKFSVYRNGRLIKGAEPSSFRVVNDSLAVDAHHVIQGYSIVEGADPATFHLLDRNPWAQDKNDYYFGGVAIHACDAATFKFLDDIWAVDAKCVYWLSSKIPDADTSTFTVVGGGFAKDIRHVYKGARIQEGVEPSACNLESVSEPSRSQPQRGCFSATSSRKP